MQITILTCGAFATYEAQYFQEYAKRINMWKFNIKEIIVKYSAKQARIKKESDKMIEFINAINNKTIILMAIDGKNFKSEEFATLILKQNDNSVRNLIFIIGGSYGISPEVMLLADHKISFGSNTWPHNMAKIMLTEQIYRAQTIINRTNYHH